MVRPVKRYYRIGRLETASVFDVDGCLYIHHESEVYSAKHKSLADWMKLQPAIKARLECLRKCFEDDAEWKCCWCQLDQHGCSCEIDANGLVWDENGPIIPMGSAGFPF